ncbi:MAG: hypothetical protein ACYC9Q_14170 [Bacillota bacterium]
MSQVKGVEQVKRRFRELPSKVIGKLVDAVDWCDRRVANEAKGTKLFKDRTAHLRGSIQPVPPKVEKNVVIGQVVAGAEYAAFVHEGTRAHRIDSPIKIAGVGWRYIGMHPGTSPRPFMQQALDASGADIKKVLTAAVRDALPKG